MANGTNKKLEPQRARKGLVGPRRESDKRQTLLGVLTGERGKKVSPHKGSKCEKGQVWDQKLKKCKAMSGPTRKAYKSHKTRELTKTASRRMDEGLHNLMRD